MAGYRLVENARLDARNTFRVAARAPMLVEVADAAALPELFGYAMLRDGPVLVLGGGSNLLFAGDPDGAVLALARAEDRNPRRRRRRAPSCAPTPASNGTSWCCGRWARALPAWKTSR